MTDEQFQWVNELRMRYGLAPLLRAQPHRSIAHLRGQIERALRPCSPVRKVEVRSMEVIIHGKGKLCAAWNLPSSILNTPVDTN